MFYYGIDGTGPFRDHTYATNFKNSYVNLFSREFSWMGQGYSRGPSNDGISTKDKGSDAAKAIQQWMGSSRPSMVGSMQEKPLVVLAGYSRGGAAAIHACNLLRDAGIMVDALLLFDAVDRAVNLSGVEQVPWNVRAVFHARRASSTDSRTSFGNCGTALARPPAPMGLAAGTYRERFFYGTHGAMGGMPWVSPTPRQQPPVTAGTVAKALLSSQGPLMGIGSKIGDRLEIMRHNSKVAAHDPAVDTIKESFSLSDTNVTYKQETEAVAQVGHWMRSGLQMVRSQSFRAAPPRYLA